MRNAGAVIHSHGMESCLITMLHPFSKEFRVKLSKCGIKSESLCLFLEYRAYYFCHLIDNFRQVLNTVLWFSFRTSFS